MNCKYWECIKCDQIGECEEADGECLGDYCEDFHRCGSCTRSGTEECPNY